MVCRIQYLIELNKDKIKPEVKYGDNVYEINLFGKGIGFSICIVYLGNGIIKPVYRDSKYVSIKSKLIVYARGNSINIARK